VSDGGCFQAFQFRRRGSLCDAERSSSPVDHLIRVVQQPLRDAPVRHCDGATAALIDKGPKPFCLKVPLRFIIGFKIERVVGNQTEHDAVGIDPRAAEHAAHAYGAKPAHAVLEKLNEALAGTHRR
jgi:hypothetical protein